MRAEEIGDLLRVTETPFDYFGDGQVIYTARRTPGIDPPRWQVFRSGQFTPAGYIEAFYSPEEFEAWALRVTDGNGRLIGSEQIEGDRTDLASVSGYQNALVWIHERAEGRA